MNKSIQVNGEININILNDLSRMYDNAVISMGLLTWTLHIGCQIISYNLIDTTFRMKLYDPHLTRDWLLVTPKSMHIELQWEGILPGLQMIAFATEHHHHIDMLSGSCCVTNMPDTIIIFVVGFKRKRKEEYIHIILKGLEYLLVGV